MADQTPTLTEAESILRMAQEEYASAHQNAEQARSVETTALNRLNQAQRAFDEAVQAMKAKAPWNSDWYASARRRDRALVGVIGEGE